MKDGKHGQIAVMNCRNDSSFTDTPWTHVARSGERPDHELADGLASMVVFSKRPPRTDPKLASLFARALEGLERATQGRSARTPSSGAPRAS